MGIEKTLIQPEPVISAIINGDNTGILKIDGEEHPPYEAPDVDGLRQALMKRVIGEAATLGRPVRVTSMDDTGVSYLVVSPPTGGSRGRTRSSRWPFSRIRSRG